MLGSSKLCLEDYTGALADLNKALEIDFNYADAYLHRGLVKYIINDV